MNNVLLEYTNFILKQFNFYAKEIMQKYYNEQIFDEIVKEYINIRYYNIYPQKQNYKTTINFYLNKKIKELCYENQNKIENITFMVDIFNYLIYLDDEIEALEVNKLEDKLEKIREKYELSGKIEFSKQYREYKKIKKEFFKAYETEDFFIEFKKINSKKIYDTKLNHNIKLSEIYSEKAIKKVFDSKLINEDKLFVLYNLVAIKILKEIINYDYITTYLVDFNINLISKNEKFNRLLKIIDNDITKEKLCFKIDYYLFLENQEKIFSLINEGYNFALIVDETYEKTEYESLFKYVLDRGEV
ncbi:MAG: hypothetical protein E7170_03035 [Firmicutes bacterium]|nr:hypothetical protein [Bacillota bacterium]